MNAKCFVTLTLILTLSLVCLLNYSPALYPEGAFDFTTLATTTTLEAVHIIVGEVTHVSFVFERGESGPISFVTVRVDKDIKEAIERVDNQATNPPEKKESNGEGETPPRTATFVQTGGPYPNGSWVKAAGIRVLKQGDRVFLRLGPTVNLFEYNGQTVNSGTAEFGTTYSIKEEGDDIDQHIIKRGWRGLDTTVLEMTRIVRATLKEPEQMRTFERQMNGFKHLTKEARLQEVMNKVANIETALKLPPLERQ